MLKSILFYSRLISFYFFFILQSGHYVDFLEIIICRPVISEFYSRIVKEAFKTRVTKMGHGHWLNEQKAFSLFLWMTLS